MKTEESYSSWFLALAPGTADPSRRQIRLRQLFLPLPCARPGLSSRFPAFWLQPLVVADTWRVNQGAAQNFPHHSDIFLLTALKGSSAKCSIMEAVYPQSECFFALWVEAGQTHRSSGAGLQRHLPSIRILCRKSFLWIWIAISNISGNLWHKYFCKFTQRVKKWHCALCF